MYILKQHQAGTMMNYKLFLGIIVFIPACIGPKKKIPHHEFTPAFIHQHNACSVEPMREWWKQFNDCTLNELINTTLNTNYDLRIAAEKIEQFRARVSFKTAQLFPQIDGILEVSETGVSKQLAQTSFLDKKTVSLFRFGFDALWEIDLWGRIWRARKAELYAMQAQVETMRLVYITLIADVAGTYVDLCTLQQKIVLTDQLVTIEHRLTQLEKELFEAGLTSEIRVAQQRQLQMDTYDQLLTLHKHKTYTYHALALLLGIQPENISHNLCCAQQIPLVNAQLKVGLPSDLLRRRPDIRKAENELAQAYELIGQAIAQWFPSFTLFGFLDSTSSSSSGWFNAGSLSWNIGPAIRMPILNFGRISAQIKEQESVKRQAALNYSQTIITALKEVEDALVGYFTAQKQRILLQEKVDYAHLEESLVYDRQQSGLSNELQLLRTQKNRITTQLELTNIERNLSIYFITVYKALGGGW